MRFCGILVWNIIDSLIYAKSIVYILLLSHNDENWANDTMCLLLKFFQILKTIRVNTFLNESLFFFDMPVSLNGIMFLEQDKLIMNEIWSYKTSQDYVDLYKYVTN